MATHNEISSTEKLLDLIRSDNDTGGELPRNHSPTPNSERHRRVLTGARASKKTTVVGVDFGYRNLKLVKMMHLSDREWKLLDYTSISYNPQIPRTSPEFSNFLKTHLSDFCGSSLKFELWCLMFSGNVEIRYIRIPNVPKKQIANAVYWTFKKEVPFDEEESIIDFEALGDISEKGIQKTAVIVYVAPKKEIKQLEELFSGIDFPLTGISIASFAIQNLLRTHWIETGEQTVGSLYIGEDWSRVDIFSSGNLVLTRGIKAGMNSLVEGIIEGMQELEINSSSELAEGEEGIHPETPGMEMPVDMEQARKILVSIRPDSPSLTKTDPGFDLKEEEIFMMIQAPLERLLRRVETSLEHFALTLEVGEVSKFYISGEIHAHRQLDEYISEEIGIRCEILDPLDPANPFMEDVSPALSPVQRSSFGSALGMALSRNSLTPNLILTYRDKEKLAGITRINRAILAVFAVIVVICTGVFLWQESVVKDKQVKIVELKKKMGKYSPPVNQNLIFQLSAKVKQNRHKLKEYSRRYKAMAVLAELSRLTPPNIRLLSFTAKIGRVSEAKNQVAKNDLVLEGMVFGDQQRLEGSLGTYLLRMESSPLFSQAGIHKKSSFELHEGRKVLHFMVRMVLV